MRYTSQVQAHRGGLIGMAVLFSPGVGAVEKFSLFSRNSHFFSCRVISLCTLLFAGMVTGCAETEFKEPGLDATQVKPVDAIWLARSAGVQHSLGLDSNQIQTDFSELSRTSDWGQRGYFSASEHDRLERLLFGLMAVRAAFWGQLHGCRQALVEFPEDSRCHVLMLHADFALADSAAFLVAQFAGDPVAISKLNEAFYRSEIPSGTYDQLLNNLIAEAGTARRLQAWQLYSEGEALTFGGPALSDPEAAEFASIRESIPILHARVMKNTAAGIPAGRLHPHTVAQALEKNGVVRHTEQGFGNLGYRIQSLVFKDVSRIKNPTVQAVSFTREQHRQIHDLLRPGDILLSYTAGYISDVFIPGKFKHGMTYVGTGPDREYPRQGRNTLLPMSDAAREKYDQNLNIMKLGGGDSADLIEAVAEGVKFSSLDHILDTHINRLLVLRPLINDDERDAFLARVFAFLGDAYDFRFDFSDASRQVCTELIYRALQGRGEIEFQLTQRAGHPTLSADDIARYFLPENPTHFDLILYAARDEERPGVNARVWTGAEGEEKLKQLMNDQSSEAH